jgi:flagellar motor switch protein FliN/FliY
MNDGLLSQEEIEALLNGGTIESPAAEGGTDSPESAAPEAAPAEEDISDIERDALGEIGNISMGSAATTLSILLGRKVSITTPRVSLGTIDAIKNQYPMPYLIVEVGYTIGINGNNLLAIREQDALIIASLMMGGDGTNPAPQLDEIAMSAVGEAMNQMMGAVATSLSTMFNKKVDISPPKTTMIDLGTEQKLTEIVSGTDTIVKTAFRMEVEGLIDSEIMQILPIDTAKDMVETLVGGAPPETPEPEPVPVAQVAPPTPPPQPAAAPPPPPPQPQPQMQYAQPQYAQPQQMMYAPPATQNIVAPTVPVQPVQFAPLTGPGLVPGEGNLNLIMDVPLQVTVELGRTRKVIKDILELSTGSIIELDKLAGEPVDILVNGKLLAKGEVVVIDENFGVRITDIVSPLERARTIQ